MDVEMAVPELSKNLSQISKGSDKDKEMSPFQQLHSFKKTIQSS